MTMFMRYQQQPVPSETIYNLINVPDVSLAEGSDNNLKFPKTRYTSKFHSDVLKEEKANKKPHAFLGLAEIPKPRPTEFITKRSGEFKLPEKKPFKYPDEDKKKPAVPKHGERPTIKEPSNTNFITTNAVKNIASVPKKPMPKFVDSPSGTTFPLESSGLTPKYSKKKDYGKVPEYLTKRQMEMQRAQEEYEEYIKECQARGAMKQVTQEERADILIGLKKNWETLLSQYQGLSVVTDTVPKRLRKQRLEDEMKQLENDIALLEKHRTIYIADK